MLDNIDESSAGKDFCLEPRKMEAFLSTLASVSVTILALLAASYAAYAVFYGQQAAKFDDLIAEDKVVIRDQLFKLRAHWSGSLGVFLNPEFKDNYRARLGGIAGAGFVNKAAADVIFGGSEMQQALAEVRTTDTMPGPERGRFYLWAVNEAILFLTKGMVDQGQGQSDLFPFNAGGAGFEEWRQDFEGASQAVSMLSIMKDPMLQDFSQFLATLPEVQRNNIWPYAQTGVTNAFAEIESIRTTLKDIDRQSLLKKPYSFSERTHGKWIFVLGLLAFTTGVALPIGLLATNINQSTIGGVSLLIATLAFALGSVVLFGWDVLHKTEANKANYVRDRWRADLLQKLKEGRTRLSQGSLLGRDEFLDAKNSREAASLPETVRSALDQYATASEAYNQVALALSLKVTDTLVSGSKLSTLSVPPAAQTWTASLTLSPLQILDQQAVSNVLSSLKQNPQQGVSIEIQRATWSRVVARIRPISTVAESAELTNRLGEISRKFQADPMKTQFDSARERASTAARSLEAALESWK
jgi:hypothetical protein